MEFRAVFLVAVIACIHLVFSVEGRAIKSVIKNGSKQISQQKEDHNQAAVQSYSPSVSHHSMSGKKEVLPPFTPTKSSDFGDSVETDTDDFRPTTPGNSPGAGHSFTEDDEDAEQKSGSVSPSDDKHSIAGVEDFRPTNPGHSPGAGHAFPNIKSEPNA